MTDERICKNGHVLDEGKPECSRCNEPEDKKAEETPVEKAADAAADETEKTDEEKAEAVEEIKADETDADNAEETEVKTEAPANETADAEKASE